LSDDYAEADGDAGRGRPGRVWDALSAVAALVGLADAVYLTAEHLAGRSVLCMVVSGCDKVLMSDYATLPGGYPLAALGALAYFAAFSLAVLACFGYERARPLLDLLVALMFAATLWLLYVQAFVLEAFCTYCLLSAAVTTLLLLLALARRLAGRRARLQ